MKLKLIKVDYKFFRKNVQTVLADKETSIFKLPVFPNVGDVVYYAGERYKVVQKDIHLDDDLSDENVTLFLSKLDW